MPIGIHTHTERNKKEGENGSVELICPSADTAPITGSLMGCRGRFLGAGRRRAAKTGPARDGAAFGE